MIHPLRSDSVLNECGVCVGETTKDKTDVEETPYFNAPSIDDLLGINDISTVLSRKKPSGERIHPNHRSQDVLPLVKLPSVVAQHD